MIRQFPHHVIGLVACVALAGCQRERSAPVESEPVATSRTTTSQPASDQATPEQGRRELTAGLEVAGVASCHPTADFSQALSRLVDVADTDADGQLSRQEAAGLVNFLVGGFFFRADADEDGTVTPEEGRQARAELVARYPAIGILLSEAAKTTRKSPFAALAEVLDIDYGKPLSASEARDVARRAVDDLYKIADADDNQAISIDEVRVAGWQGVRALGRTAFRAADQNADRKLTLAEFESALDAPVKFAFNAADTDDNGRLTEPEAAVAIGQLARRLGVPMPTDGNKQ